MTLDNWQVESLRLTVFRSSAVDKVVSLWEALNGEKPTNIDSQPRENILREEGPISLGTLTHVSNPIRIDWILTSSQEQNTGAFPIIGSFNEIMGQFAVLMSKWLSLETAPEIKRMALGSTILLPVDNRESAYTQLSTFLPYVQLDSKNSTDFLYQINRPIKSRVEPDLEVNRLSKWSAARVVGMGIFIGDKPEIVSNEKAHFACRLELDINTSQHYNNVLNKDKLAKIFDELQEISKAVALEGDR